MTGHIDRGGELSARDADVCAAVHGYQRQNLTPVKVRFGHKAAIEKNWQAFEAPDDPTYWVGCNVGLLLGARSNGLTDVDLDCHEAVVLAPDFLPPTDAVFGRQSKPRSHFLYITDLCESETQAVLQYKDVDGSVLCEIRFGGGSSGAQTVVPPSVHVSGEAIRWDAARAPTQVDGAHLEAAMARLAAATLLARHWPDDGRRDLALTVGGLLARYGWDADEIDHFITSIANGAGDEKGRDRARTARGGVRRFEAGGKTRGFPALAKAFGKEVPETFAEWLDPKPYMEIDFPDRHQRWAVAADVA